MVPASALSKNVASPTMSQSMSPKPPHSKLDPMARMKVIRQRHDQKQMRGQMKDATQGDSPSNSTENILRAQLDQQSLQITELKKDRDATSVRLKAIEDYMAGSKPDVEIEEKIAVVSARLNKLEVEMKAQTPPNDDFAKLQSDVAQLLTWKTSRTDIDGVLCATRNHVCSEVKALEARFENRMSTEHDTIKKLSSMANSLDTFRKDMLKQDLLSRTQDLSSRSDMSTVSNGHMPENSYHDDKYAKRDLSKQVDNLSKDVDDLNATVNGLAKRTTDAEDNWDRMHRKLDRAESGLSICEHKVETLEEHKKKSEQELADIVEQLVEQKMATKLKQLSSVELDMGLRLDKLQQETATLCGRLSACATSSNVVLLETRIKAVEESVTTVQSVEHQTKLLSEGRIELERRLSDVQESLAALESAYVSRFTTKPADAIKTGRAVNSISDLADVSIGNHDLKDGLYNLKREVDQHREVLKVLYADLEQTERDVHDLKALRSLQEIIPKICKADFEKTFDPFRQQVDSALNNHNTMFQALQSQVGHSERPVDPLQNDAIHELRTLLQQQVDATDQRIKDLALKVDKPADLSQHQELLQIRTNLEQELATQGQKIADLALKMEKPATSMQNLDSAQLRQDLQGEMMGLGQTVTGLQQELATQGHKIQELMHQLDLKADIADVIQNMNRYTHSFKALQDRYDNIYTEELHMKMVHWFLQQFPNNTASLMDKMKTMCSDVAELKQVSRKLSQLDVAKLVAYTPHLDSFADARGHLQHLLHDHAATQEALRIANEALASATESASLVAQQQDSIQSSTKKLEDDLSKMTMRVKDIQSSSESTKEELGRIMDRYIDPNKEFFMMLIPAIVAVGQLQTIIRKINQYIRDQSKGRDKVEIFDKFIFNIEHMLRNRNPEPNENFGDRPNGPKNQQ